MKFLYESLSDMQKDSIDNEIKEYLKEFIYERGYDYSDAEFHSLMCEIILCGKTINCLLGNAITFFNIKELVVKSKAIEIAYQLEKNRPDLKTVLEYIELCKELSKSPQKNILFDKDLANKTIGLLKKHLKGKKDGGIFSKDIDKNSSYVYTISNNIILFEEAVNRLYKNKMIACVTATEN